MFGFSIFLNEELSEATFDYMEAMKNAGFTGIFTSIHIPEEDERHTLTRLKMLANFAKRHSMELMVDISGNALNKVGLDFKDVTPLLEWGVTGLRMDYGIDNETIANLSHALTIALNASTISEKDLGELRTARANFSNMEAWHNYYPRPETGLGTRDFKQQNQWLKANDFTVMTFVPGNKTFRGPLCEGLPTLEKHRGMNPFVAALEMEKLGNIDKIFIGDPEISEEVRQQFGAYQLDNTLILRANSINKQSEFLKGQHSNRMDAARDAIRSAEARLRKPNKILPMTVKERPMGSITIDNDLYERYAGEVQITKRDLPADEKVNVVGHVLAEYQPLIAYCGPGQKFEIIWED